MPRGYPLSELVKDGIWELRAEGLSDREIGRRLVWSWDCEQSFEVGGGYTAEGSSAPGALLEPGGA